MANLDDIEDIAITVGGMTLFQRLVARYGLLNVLFFGALIAFLILAFVLWGFGQLINMDTEQVWEKSKTTDSVYLADHYFKDTASQGLYTKRLIRPMTSADVDAMHIPTWKKDKLKMGLDSTLKPDLISRTVVFMKDSAIKYRTAFIGAILKKDSTIYSDVVINHRFVIKPDFKIAHDLAEPDTLPKGYVFADDNYYVTANLTSLQKPETITKLGPPITAAINSAKHRKHKKQIAD